MSKPFFTRFEDHVVFSVSRVFWHLFIWTSCFAVVFGVVAWLWSMTPTSKEQVKRSEYPPEVKVEVGDFVFEQPAPVVNDHIETTQPSALSSSAGTPAVAPIAGEEPPTVRDPMEAMFEAVLDSLVAKYPHLGWNASVRTYITSDLEYNYYMRKGDRKTAQNFVRTVVEGEGLRDKIKRFMTRSNVNGYTARLKFLRTLFGDLDALHVDSIGQEQVVNKILRMNKPKRPVVGDISRSFRLARIFDAPERVPAFSWAIDFCARSQDGQLSFTDSAAVFLSSFELDQKYPALVHLGNNLVNSPGGDVGAYFRMCSSYPGLLSNIPRKQQAESLSQFFAIYATKNVERRKAMEAMDRQYQEMQLSAELRHRSTQNTKNEMGSKASWWIIGGIVVIALVGLILAILSMQRAISKLETAIVRNGIGQTLPSSHRDERG
ncbi:MAG: hypothetical protein ABI432_15005 [Flavobacteriales bacterium]